MTYPMSSLQLSPDAVTVLGLAGTALPFAQSVDEEVERWLRPLRLYGEAGSALQALGVSEGRPSDAPASSQTSAETPTETLHQVTVAASRIAADRGGTTVGTSDILIAVMRHYGDAFDRALKCRLSDSAELMSLLEERAHCRN